MFFFSILWGFQGQVATVASCFFFPQAGGGVGNGTCVQSWQIKNGVCFMLPRQMSETPVVEICAAKAAERGCSVSDVNQRYFRIEVGI